MANNNLRELAVACFAVHSLFCCGIYFTPWMSQQWKGYTHVLTVFYKCDSNHYDATRNRYSKWNGIGQTLHLDLYLGNMPHLVTLKIYFSRPHFFFTFWVNLYPFNTQNCDDTHKAQFLLVIYHCIVLSLVSSDSVGSLR